MVAPPAGAWIETELNGIAEVKEIVAPPAGAWIETVQQLLIDLDNARRAPRGRVD